jgi:hypothetical protein
MKLLGIISVCIDVTDKLLIRSFAFVRYWKEMRFNQTVHQLFVDFKKACDSVRREVLYNILIESGVPRVLSRIFGPKRDEDTGGWRKLHNEELHNFYSSPSIIRVIKSRRMRWAGHVTRIGRKGMHIGYWWESQKERDN